MTEPVQRVSRTTGVGQRLGLREKPERGYGETGKQDSEHEDDQVEISEEARKRVAGKHKKNILEYLDETT